MTEDDVKEIISEQVNIPSWVWNPRKTILGVVLGYVFTNFVQPIAASIYAAGMAIVDSVLVMFYGQDKIWSAEGQYGIADLPLVATEIVLNVINPIISAVFSVVTQFNAAIAQAAAEGGLAAPPVVTLLVFIEVSGTLYALWYGFMAIDFPIIKKGAIIKLITYPVRWWAGLFSSE